MVARPSVVALALVPAVLWGFSPVLSKRGLEAGGSSLQASLTVVVVDSAVYWVALAATGGLGVVLALSPWTLGVFAFAGAVGTALGRLATFAGTDRVGASVNSAGISTRPLFATLLALVWLGEPVGPATAVGVVVLVAGLVVLAFARGGDLRGWRIRDLAFPLAAAACFAVGNVVRRYGLGATPADPLSAVAINEAAALVALVGYTLVAGRRDVLSAPRASYRYFTGSGLLTAVALLALFAALAREGGRVALVDPLAGTAPLFTALFAAALLRDVERVTRRVVGGGALIVVGAALITLV